MFWWLIGMRPNGVISGVAFSQSRDKLFINFQPDIQPSPTLPTCRLFPIQGRGRLFTTTTTTTWQKGTKSTGKRQCSPVGVRALCKPMLAPLKRLLQLRRIEPWQQQAVTAIKPLRNKHPTWETRKNGRVRVSR